MKSVFLLNKKHTPVSIDKLKLCH